MGCSVIGHLIDNSVLANNPQRSPVVGQRRLTLGGVVPEVVPAASIAQGCPPRQLGVGATRDTPVSTGTVGRPRPIGHRQVVSLLGASAVEIPHRLMPSVTLVYRNAEDFGLQVSHDGHVRPMPQGLPH